MAKKTKHSCWCGKSFGTDKGLTLHKTKKDHYKTPAQKQADAEAWGKKFEELKRRTEKYLGEETHSLANGRHLKVGDKLRFERYAVIKEITYIGEENQSVEVVVDLVTKTYEHIPHTK